MVLLTWKITTLRKLSKGVKITRYPGVELIWEEKYLKFQCILCTKTYKQEVHDGVFFLAAKFEGAQPLSFIILLVWLLHGHKLHLYLWLWVKANAGTLAPQLCTLCEQLVSVQCLQSWSTGWFSQIEGAVPLSGHGLCNLGQFTRWSWLA